MKQVLAILLFTCSCFTVLAQKNKPGETLLYIFNEKWDPCKIEEAKYLGCFDKLNDTAYRWRYYHFTGPLINIETFKDKEGTTPHGFFGFYDSNGNVDSSGYTYNGRKDKWWYYYTDSLSVWQSEEYDKGKLLQRKDEIALRKEYATRNEADTSHFEKVEKEATFKGKIKGWIKYLQENLKFPERANQLNKSGTVMVSFVIDKEGKTKDISISRSVEFSLDEEATRLIKESPVWQPAIQNAKPVNAYRRQPITFAIQ